MLKFRRSNHKLKTSYQLRIFILHVPLQPNKRAFLTGRFHAQMSLIFKLLGRVKPTSISHSLRA